MSFDIDGRSFGAASSSETRLAFVRSVYLWLMGGFAVAAVGAMSAPFVLGALVAAMGRFAIWPVFIGYFAAFFWARSVSRRKPQNRYAFALFTYIAGIFAGLVMAAVAQSAGPGIVLQAFALTAVDFLVLSGVALVSKRDFSFLGSFITVGFTVILGAIVIGLFYHAEVFHLLISALIVIACSAKILWDTSVMLRTGDTGDAAGFALSLFISLLNIFLNLLRLLSGGRRD